MRFSWLRNVAASGLILATSNGACAQQADFNKVGSQMAIMLQNSHFARLPYDAELGRRFLSDYLSDLDNQRLYFTQADVEDFEAKYADKLHQLLVRGNAMAPAVEIYELFRQRVAERVAYTEALLEKNAFDFETDQTFDLTRKDASWPVDAAEARRLWQLQTQGDMLSETLRRETITRLAAEQGKADPGVKDRSPREKISLRYQRFLNTINDADEEEIANYFLSSIARAYDPHTDYMSAREMSRFKDGMRNELVGIGALLQGEEDGATKIMGIVVGGPADREGSLKLNDRIIAVDSLNTGEPEDMVDIMFMRIDRVVDLIRGKEGTRVGLKVEPASGAPGETRLIVIDRGKVEMKDEQARGDIIEKKTDVGEVRRIGVITLPSFYADFDEGRVLSSVDVERILTRFVEENISGLVLDLRGNGGGSLEEVRRMTGFFIPRGPVVQVKNTIGQVQVKETDAAKPIYDGPMVVITDKTSASASEILAGALQDYNRAVIIGESSTFGKGTVQQPMDIGRMLPLFSARDRAGFLKVTIQKFYRPSGSSTQKEGVVPDIVLPSITDALDIGEASLKNPLAHDRISPAAGFRQMNADHLFLPRLKELSQERVRKDQDFKYVIEDVLRNKERIERNQISLNIATRKAELEEVDAMQKKRNAERRERFGKVAERDAGLFKFFRLTLDDLATGEDLKQIDPTDESGDNMRRATDETAELDDTPEWPSRMDPMKREAITVLSDLVDITENARMAGMLNRQADSP
ncbi:MAG: carboxy terminal-processing peptidase [Luteolibacter sp.]